MGIEPAEFAIIAAVLAACLLVVFPVVGIPRALRRVGKLTRSLRGVVFASAGVVVAMLGLASGAMNWFFCLVVAALNGCWLGAAVWANRKAARPSTQPASPPA